MDTRPDLRQIEQLHLDALGLEVSMVTEKRMPPQWQPAVSVLIDSVISSFNALICEILKQMKHCTKGKRGGS